MKNTVSCTATYSKYKKKELQVIYDEFVGENKYDLSYFIIKF